MSTPTIGQHMTSSPHSIGFDQTLAAARDMMETHRIRHLPVLEGGRCVGVVTERDLNLVQTLRDVDPATLPVEEAMTPDPYAVSADTPLEEVIATMRDRRYGSAVVIDHGKVIGVFTTVDALGVLHDCLSKGRNA